MKIYNMTELNNKTLYMQELTTGEGFLKFVRYKSASIAIFNPCVWDEDNGDYIILDGCEIYLTENEVKKLKEV